MHGSIDVSVWDDQVTGNQTQVNAVRHISPLDFHYVTLNNLLQEDNTWLYGYIIVITILPYKGIWTNGFVCKILNVCNIIFICHW